VIVEIFTSHLAYSRVSLFGVAKGSAGLIESNYRISFRIFQYTRVTGFRLTT